MSTPTRHDGRRDDETRPLTVVFEGLARVDGSARFGFGATSALASLSGPIEVRLVNELPNKATFEVLVRPLANIAATDAKATASTLKSALEPSLLLAKHPRTLVQLVVQSLSAPLAGSSAWSSSVWADSSAPTVSAAAVAAQWKDVLMLPALMNAGTMALLNASSVPMRGVVLAVSVGRLASSSSTTTSSSDSSSAPAPTPRLVLDPSEDEAEHLDAGGCFAFLFADGAGAGLDEDNTDNADCVWSSWKAVSGGYDQEELFAARRLAQKGAQSVYKRVRARMAGEEEHGDKRDQEKEEEEAVVEGRDDDDDDKMEI